jgi:hypothetical protein
MRSYFKWKNQSSMYLEISAPEVEAIEALSNSRPGETHSEYSRGRWLIVSLRYPIGEQQLEKCVLQGSVGNEELVISTSSNHNNMAVGWVLSSWENAMAKIASGPAANLADGVLLDLVLG